MTLRNPIALVGLAFLALILITTSLFTVSESQQAIIVRLGKPDRIVNRYNANDPFGATGAGLTLKAPFIENVVWVDKRIRDLDMPQQVVLSTDQLRLVVDAFARFRIVDPLRMYQTVRSEDRVADELSRILGSRLRNELGRQTFATLLSPERGQLMDTIQEAVNREASRYGAEIVDVRIKRADLPPGDPLQSAFLRMQTARQQEAESIRAQGRKQAQIIRAEADAEASRVYGSPSARIRNSTPFTARCRRIGPRSTTAMPA